MPRAAPRTACVTATWPIRRAETSWPPEQATTKMTSAARLGSSGGTPREMGAPGLPCSSSTSPASTGRPVEEPSASDGLSDCARRTLCIHTGELDVCAWGFPIFLRGDDVAYRGMLRIRVQRSMPRGHGVCTVATTLVLVVWHAPYASRMYD